MTDNKPPTVPRDDELSQWIQGIVYCNDGMRPEVARKMEIAIRRREADAVAAAEKEANLIGAMDELNATAKAIQNGVDIEDYLKIRIEQFRAALTKPNGASK